MDFAGFNEDCVVSDIVYVPLETELLAQARAHGLRTVDGLGMLLHQAVPGFEKWFGVRPQVTPELRDLIVADIEGRTMLIVGLTGSIGMGKSTAAAHLRARGIAGVRCRRGSASPLCRWKSGGAGRARISGHDDTAAASIAPS